MNNFLLDCLLLASIGSILLLLGLLFRRRWPDTATTSSAPTSEMKVSDQRLAEISARVAAAHGALALIRDATEDGGIRFTVQALMDDRAPLAMDYLEHALEDYADLAADLVAAREELSLLRMPRRPMLKEGPREEVDGLDIIRERLRRRAMERIREAATRGERAVPGVTGPVLSSMEGAARADGLEGAGLARAMVTYALAKAVQALWAVEDAVRTGHLAGTASLAVQAARERAVEAKAHLERALESQKELVEEATP